MYVYLKEDLLWFSINSKIIFHEYLKAFLYILLCRVTYRVFIKNCVFLPVHRIPSPAFKRATYPRERVYSHSYWLTTFCTTNSSPVLAKQRSQNIEHSWKITQYLMDILYKNTLSWNKYYYSIQLYIFGIQP